MLTEREIAYIAGIVDGEGTVRLQRHPGSASGRYYYPVVRVNNTHQGLMEWLQETYPSTKLHYSVLPPPRKPRWEIVWIGKPALRLLRIILPHLIVKRRQAEVVLGIETINRGAAIALNDKRVFDAGCRIPPWLVVLREAAFDEISALNKRGQ